MYILPSCIHNWVCPSTCAIKQFFSDIPSRTRLVSFQRGNFIFYTVACFNRCSYDRLLLIQLVLLPACGAICCHVTNSLFLSSFPTFVKRTQGAGIATLLTVAFQVWHAFMRFHNAPKPPRMSVSTRNCPRNITLLPDWNNMTTLANPEM